jgi:hypothetical protein
MCGYYQTHPKGLNIDYYPRLCWGAAGAYQKFSCTHNQINKHACSTCTLPIAFAFACNRTNKPCQTRIGERGIFFYRFSCLKHP